MLHDSQHDEEGMVDSCTPFTDNGSPNGNFIMFASATTGSKSNNDDFSPCSLDSIALVLQAVVNGDGSKTNCFKGKPCYL